MVKKLLHTRYRVHDLEKTTSFYKDVLGFRRFVAIPRDAGHN